MSDPQEQIVQIREWLDISQAELGRRLGTTQPAILRYERGQRPVPGPVCKLLELIAEVRGVSFYLEENKDD